MARSEGHEEDLGACLYDIGAGARAFCWVFSARQFGLGVGYGAHACVLCCCREYCFLALRQKPSALMPAASIAPPKGFPGGQTPNDAPAFAHCRPV